jgi:hypothetical protein
MLKVNPLQTVAKKVVKMGLKDIFLTQASAEPDRAVHGQAPTISLNSLCKACLGKLTDHTFQ